MGMLQLTQKNTFGADLDTFTIAVAPCKQEVKLETVCV